eukprot:381247-Rhodomonas_salina.2
MYYPPRITHIAAASASKFVVIVEMLGPGTVTTRATSSLEDRIWSRNLNAEADGWMVPTSSTSTVVPEGFPNPATVTHMSEPHTPGAQCDGRPA